MRCAGKCADYTTDTLFLFGFVAYGFGMLLLGIAIHQSRGARAELQSTQIGKAIISVFWMRFVSKNM